MSRCGPEAEPTMGTITCFAYIRPAAQRSQGGKPKIVAGPSIRISLGFHGMRLLNRQRRQN